MSTYNIRSEDGCEIAVGAESLTEAIEATREWIRDGDWGKDPAYVQAWVSEKDSDEETYVEVLVNKDGPGPPDCVDGHEHAWRTSYELVGGSRENPGIWSMQGTQIMARSVCARCGMYQRYVSESTPRQYPHEPAHSTYEAADEASLTWVADLEGARRRRDLARA